VFGAPADEDEDEASEGGSGAENEEEGVDDSGKQVGAQEAKKDERFHEQDGQ